MNIEKLTIQNFRNVGDTEVFSFNPKFTVIIGINGKGKSTILYALRIAAGAYLLGIPEALKRSIWENEIRIKNFGDHDAKQTPVLIKASGSIDGKQLKKEWQRQIPDGKTKTTSSNEDVGEIRDLANAKYKSSTKLGEFNIDNPVIAYFGTKRSYGNSRNTLGSYTKRLIYKYGYYSWFDMQYSTYQYTKWLQANQGSVYDGKENQDTRTAFVAAIKCANPYITGIYFDGIELRMKVKMSDSEAESEYLPLSLHSDGIIAHTGMVAELAFRCIMLNGHYGIHAIEKSRGIVMIDELDMHLHPNWQRHVVADLKKAFPSIQFVVTTHSPFIVQSLKSDEIWNLDKSMDVSPDEFKIDDVATRIMGVSSAYSSENQASYETSKDFLNKLDQNVSKSELDKELENISDPAIRAFLELNKMAKGK